LFISVIKAENHRFSSVHHDPLDLKYKTFCSIIHYHLKACGQ